MPYIIFLSFHHQMCLFHHHMCLLPLGFREAAARGHLESPSDTGERDEESLLVVRQICSKTGILISSTETCPRYAFSAEMIGAYDEGIRLFGNSVVATFHASSQRKDVVSRDMVCSDKL